MARKRQDRVVKTSHKKGQKTTKNASDSETDGYVSFNNNLAVLGLNLREVPGDGNCLFRALGDQLEGHGRNHVKHRLKTVQYMQQNRADFEPFVEDDKSFDYHISNLSKPGIYAGNDAIVAFARLHGATVFIHQLDAPLWQINGGSDKSGAGTELHIAYHNGDHYNSIRKLGDNSEAPANIRLGNDHGIVSEDCGSHCDKLSESYQYCNSEDDCEITATTDSSETNITKNEFSDSDSMNETHNHLLKCSHDGQIPPQTGLWGPNGTGTRIMGPIEAAKSLPDIKESNPNISDEKPHHRRLSTKERKAMKRLERKKESLERKRQNDVIASRHDEGDGMMRMMLKDLGCLTI